jgi:hypothetical protein
MRGFVAGPCLQSCAWRWSTCAASRSVRSLYAVCVTKASTSSLAWRPPYTPSDPNLPVVFSLSVFFVCESDCFLSVREVDICLRFLCDYFHCLWEWLTSACGFCATVFIVCVSGWNMPVVFCDCFHCLWEWLKSTCDCFLIGFDFPVTVFLLAVTYLWLFSHWLWLSCECSFNCSWSGEDKAPFRVKVNTSSSLRWSLFRDSKQSNVMYTLKWGYLSNRDTFSWFSDFSGQQLSVGVVVYFTAKGLPL